MFLTSMTLKESSKGFSSTQYVLDFISTSKIEQGSCSYFDASWIQL
jgi:hypothetical protein